MANTLRKNLREEEQVAPLGGDEFVIIFFHFNKDDLEKNIYRIKTELLSISCKKYPDIPLSLGHLEKLPFRPNSSLREKFSPQNITYMPAVKFFSRLDLELNC